MLTASSMALEALYAIWMVLYVWLIMELMFTMLPLLFAKWGRAACRAASLSGRHTAKHVHMSPCASKQEGRFRSIAPVETRVRAEDSHATGTGPNKMSGPLQRVHSMLQRNFPCMSVIACALLKG